MRAVGPEMPKRVRDVCADDGREDAILVYLPFKNENIEGKGKREMMQKKSLAKGVGGKILYKSGKTVLGSVSPAGMKVLQYFPAGCTWEFDNERLYERSLRFHALSPIVIGVEWKWMESDRQQPLVDLMANVSSKKLFNTCLRI